MLSKPQGYDEAKAYTGEFQSLPAGLYVCEIKQIQQAQTRTGRPQLVVLFDIAEGEQKGFYSSQYEAEKASGNAKWRGVHKQIMDGSSIPFFKGLMTSIEKSNPGYFFPWGRENNEKTLHGKKFGAVMGREQFQAQDGSLKFATRVFQIRSIEGLKTADVPADKLLENTQPAQAYTPSSAGDGFMNIPDGIIGEELPFN